MARYLYQKFLYFEELRSLRVLVSGLYQAGLACIVLICLLNNFQILGNSDQHGALGPGLASVKMLEHDFFIDNKKIVFAGNKFFSLEALTNNLFVLEDAGFLEQRLLLNDLLKLFKDNGFLEPSIAIEEQNNAIIFTIIEGSRAKINDIIVSGVINSECSLIVKDIFSTFEQDDYFDKETLNALLRKVKNELACYGYWDFELKKYTLFLNKNYYDLILEVDQGAQRLLKKIVIDNVSGVDIDLGMVKLPVFDRAIPFDFNLIDHYKNQILEALPSNFELQINHEILSDQKQLDDSVLHFRLTPRKISYFGEIIINGCSKTLPEVIIQNLTFKEGDVWDFDKIEQSLKKLKNLKIFKSISIIPTDFLHKNSIKNTVINVVEDSTFEVVARVGFAQIASSSINYKVLGYLPEVTYTFGGSFLWKNISGMSDIFRLDFDTTRFSGDFAASYKRPLHLEYLPGTTWSSKIFNTQIGQPITGVKGILGQKAYIENHRGLLVTIDYEVNKFTLFLSAALDYIKVSSFDTTLFNALQIDSTFFKNRMPYLILEPSIVLNRFDNDTDPTQGFRTSLNLKAMVPFNDPSKSFFKLLFEHSQVIPITTGSAFAFKFRAGYIFNKNFETLLPTERFYLGGLNSIRGYESNMVPPINSLHFDDGHLSGLPSNGAASAASTVPIIYVPLGSKFMINLKGEWRCQLYNKLSGAIFNDIGLLNHKRLTDSSERGIVGATGFGLRYATPVGPIQLDLGFKWKRQKEESPFSWYLTFGQSF